MGMWCLFARVSAKQPEHGPKCYCWKAARWGRPGVILSPNDLIRHALMPLDHLNIFYLDQSMRVCMPAGLHVWEVG